MELWPSIESLHNLFRSMQHKDFKEKITFFGTPKIDGTNAGINFDLNNKVTCYSRTRSITPEDDNYGFAKWALAGPAHSLNEILKNTQSFHEYGNFLSYTIWGEWAGPGINKGTAITKIPQRTFFIFAIVFHFENYSLYTNAFILPNEKLPSDIQVLLVIHTVTFDFASQEQNQKVIDGINLLVEALEKEDPYIKNIYNISGTGEGIVYSNFSFSTPLLFKVKGQKHRVNRTEKAAQLFVPKQGLEEILNNFCTEQRYNQAISTLFENPSQITIKDISPFIQWVLKDIEKESIAELQEANLTFKEIKSQASLRTANWFKNKYV